MAEFKDNVEKEARSRKKKKLGSYPYTSVIFSITLALFVIGLFGLLLLHTNKLTEVIKENIEIQVYLEKGITNNQRIQIQKTLSSKDYAALKNEEVQISFVSKEDAAKEFIEETGEDFTAFLGENPLRDAYILRIAPEFHDAAKLKSIKEEIEKINGVFEVVYVESLVESINENMAKIGIFLLGFAAILLIAVVILINNTIKLALFSQRFLIRSMQLVGAKASFIQKPFLLRASLHGVFAGLLASALLYLLMNFANKKIEDLAALQETDKILILFVSLLVLGALIGFSSTFRAINKYLKLSLDELY
ncbi:Cell division protein FtsX [Fulvivirga imtechensis AK7]|uniref:Cell division protein FtsX n=1 Tax=Fulvivirga imtechensis AK7 TaxID=1237149 RepID=L8JKV6_9BACT|nr:permease-like cell division protein FtsX [Fulvivirga imtechensis]ELR68057.1 Cell division protein FtsX [Fulvivirga imtechensis AK7]